jgi:hypothetical protein
MLPNWQKPKHLFTVESMKKNVEAGAGKQFAKGSGTEKKLF